MTTEEFIEWLNKEMIAARNIASDRRNPEDVRTFQYGKLRMAEDIMSKYLTLLPPATTLN